MATPYILDWSNTTLKPSFNLPVGVIDTSTTSLSLTGRDTANWGERLQENMMHIMENFASPTAPPSPTYGQLWYDTNLLLLKIYTIAGIWSVVFSEALAALPPAPSPAPAPAFTASATTSLITPASISVGTFIPSLDLVTTPISLSNASLIAGVLPTGMVLSSNTNAYITGTPTTAGLFSGTIRVQHTTASVPAFLDQTFSVNVSTPGTAFTLTELTTLGSPSVFTKDTTYTISTPQSFIGSGNTTLDTVTLLSGSIPSGMVLSVSGSSVRLSGTPTVAGTYSGSVQATQTQSGYAPATQNANFFVSVAASPVVGGTTVSYSNGGTVPSINNTNWNNVIVTPVVNLVGTNLAIDITGITTPASFTSDFINHYNVPIFLRLIDTNNNVYWTSNALPTNVSSSVSIANVPGRSYKLQMTLGSYTPGDTAISAGTISNTILQFTGV